MNTYRIIYEIFSNSRPYGEYRYMTNANTENEARSNADKNIYRLLNERLVIKTIEKL